MLKNLIGQFAVKGKVVDRFITYGNITALHFQDGDVLLFQWNSGTFSILKEQDVSNMTLRSIEALKLFREAPCVAS